MSYTKTNYNKRPEPVPTLDPDKLYRLCNMYHWFEGGTNEQYDMLFALNRLGYSCRELSLVIWICSPETNRHDIYEILRAHRIANH